MWWLLPRRWSYYGWQYVEELGGEQVQTDWNQNDTTAKDYIKNRPGGYETGFEITWDGDTTGRVSATAEGMPVTWYKVSDKILTPDQVIGSTITKVKGSESQTIPVTDYREMEDIMLLGEMMIMIAKKSVAPTTELPMSIPEPGVYFISNDTSHVSSFSHLIVHPFDDKYIPDSIARKAELDSRITEKEVILTSSTTDSTKKFKITVNDSGTLTATEITEQEV